MRKYLIQLFTVLITLYSSIVFSTTLQKLTFDEIIESSALIIQANVKDIKIIESDSVIYTRVFFEIEEILKGDYSDEIISLDYLGGRGSKGQLIVSGQDIPRLGERGFYFIEDIDSQSVNPLTGWTQGHFRILTDNRGREIIESEQTQNVVEITKNKNSMLTNKLRQMRFRQELVEKAYDMPTSPEELRSKVYKKLQELH